MKPTILIATTARWFPTVRLGMALANAGCSVQAVCPLRHPLAKTSMFRQTHIYHYHGLAPLMSFTAAITAARPDLIIPCDDLAVQHLHQIYGREQSRRKEGAATCALIERSLGAPASFPISRERTSFMALAEEEGIRVPKTKIISNIVELREWVSQMGFPVVLKADGTSGGDGVRIVDTLEDAEKVFRSLQAPPLLARAAKWALVDQDTRLVWPSLLRHRSVVSAQTFVAGREATSVVACWEGAVLASLHCEVLNKHNSTGPATVLRLIENSDMSTTAEKIVRRLGLSGLYGFDYMLETHSRNAHLVEMNPRATQVGHLALGPGRDLPAALYAAITGRTVHESPKITEKNTIALFPHEWLKNPASPFLQSSYHDVPWEEPEFVRVCVGTRRKQRDLYFHQKWVKAFSPVDLSCQ